MSCGVECHRTRPQGWSAPARSQGAGAAEETNSLMCLPGAAGVAAAGLSCSTRRDRVGPHVQYVTDKDLAMAHFKKAFPSKFLQVSDLDPDIHATITSVGAENVGGENSDLKLVVRF